MNMSEKDIVSPEGEPNAEKYYTYNREIFYHFDKEKGFTRANDYQNDSNQVIIKQSWDAAEMRLDEVRQKVLAGFQSPIAFYMEKQLLEVPMLAAYMEIGGWRVKRHLKPRVFNKLSQKILKKYADIFEVTVEQLTSLEYLKN
jgi:hypothetical protein